MVGAIYLSHQSVIPAQEATKRRCPPPSWAHSLPQFAQRISNLDILSARGAAVRAQRVRREVAVRSRDKAFKHIAELQRNNCTSLEQLWPPYILAKILSKFCNTHVWYKHSIHGY